MDLDFHYYATYVAANAAGYSPSEAETIAHAAQYIDDSSKDKLIDPGRLGFRPIPTVHTTEELGWGNFSSSLTEAELRRVWCVFHFLPGNYKSARHPDPNSESRIRSYTGPTSDRGWTSSWTYDDYAKYQFKLLCLPYSPLATAMVNDIKNNYKGTPNELHVIGIRMHVLADTFAHMYYAGTPAWHVNDAGADVYNVTHQRARISWGGATGEWSTPTMPSYNSYMYLGHGRMGHVPDYPWINYEYQPKWSGSAITKSNRKEYLAAFLELVRAMQAIRTGSDYVPTQGTVNEDLARAVSTIMNKEHALGRFYETNVQERCGNWKAAIPGMGAYLGRTLPLPREYDAQRWLREIGTGRISDTDYFKFNVGALAHLDFVATDLTNEGIPLSHSAPVGKIVHYDDHISFKSKDFQSIGSLESGAQYYPTLNGSAVALAFGGAGGGEIGRTAGTTGDPRVPVDPNVTVSVKTSETQAGDYKYLGAWSTPCLYYYTPGYTQQNWTIERADPSVSGPIREGEALYLKNDYYNQYLCPKDSAYLTTRNEPYAWILEVRG